MSLTVPLTWFSFESVDHDGTKGQIGRLTETEQEAREEILRECPEIKTLTLKSR